VKKGRICAQENDSRDILSIARDGRCQQAFSQARESADVGLATRADRGAKVPGSGSPLRRGGGVGSSRGPRRLSRGVEAVWCRRRLVGQPAGSRLRAGPAPFMRPGRGSSGFALQSAALEEGTGGGCEPGGGARGARRRAERSVAAATPGTGRKATRQARGERPPSREARGRPMGCLDCKVRGVAAGQKVPAAFSCRSRSRLPRRQERLREEARCGWLPRPIAPDASSLTTIPTPFQ
jgi:hypothetical protein